MPYGGEKEIFSAYHEGEEEYLRELVQAVTVCEAIRTTTVGCRSCIMKCPNLDKDFDILPDVSLLSIDSNMFGI